jgi:hypothetical protein
MTTAITQGLSAFEKNGRSRSESRHPESILLPSSQTTICRIERQPNERTNMRVLRRITFDLIGLPPTVEQINAFLADRFAGRFASSG